MNRSKKNWNLLADIGGTNARFAIEDFDKRIVEKMHTYSVLQYESFESVIDAFIHDVAALRFWNSYPKAACFSVACVVDDPIIRFTNNSWQFTKSQISKKLGDIFVDVINDFESIARAIPYLCSGDCYELGVSTGKNRHQNFAIIGPGTGLGVSGLFLNKGQYNVISGEGGHVDFAPVNDQEFKIFKYLHDKYGRVSLERILSGEGIVNIYSALSGNRKNAVGIMDEVAIGKAAESGEDDFCLEVINIFFSILGSAAGNLALTLGARGGVYLAGGIVPRYITLLEKSSFRSRFEDKGRYKTYMQEIPTRVVMRLDTGIIGASDRLSVSI